MLQYNRNEIDLHHEAIEPHCELEPNAKVIIIYREHSVLSEHIAVIRKVLRERQIPHSLVAFPPKTDINKIHHWLETKHFLSNGAKLITDSTVPRSYGRERMTMDSLNMDDRLATAVEDTIFSETERNEARGSIERAKQAFLKIIAHIPKEKLPKHVALLANIHLLEHPPFLATVYSRLKEIRRAGEEITENNLAVKKLVAEVAGHIISWLKEAGMHGITLLHHPSNDQLQIALNTEKQWVITDAHTSRNHSADAQQLRGCLAGHENIKAHLYRLPLIEFIRDAQEHGSFSFTPEEKEQLKSNLAQQIIDWLKQNKLVELS
ncbi:MAG: hypothetical protein WCW27_04355 [Patescibacteria group bacterium]|jgi:hypothetical protein